MSDILQQEQSVLDGFIELLRNEQQALIKADVEALSALSDAKIKQSEQLNALAQQRAKMLAEAGYGADAAGVNGWLATQPKAVSAAWGNLMDSAKTARHLNETNGKLIHTHLQHNQMALTTLLGAAGVASVYGADGQARTTSGTTQRSIGKV